MDTVTQEEAFAATPLADDERARFFAASPFGGLECLTATFRSHRYAPHAHETYAVGAILAGCETFSSRRGRGYAGPGELVFMNPHEVHDGAPHDGGYAYRMSYPSIETLSAVAAEVSGRSDLGIPFFPQPVVHDPAGFALFVEAHVALQEEEDALKGAEFLYRFLSLAIVRHARLPAREPRREHGPVARIKALLGERFAEPLTLEDLAAEARLSRHHLIRAFARETGMTPHAFLVNRRINAAETLLRAGLSPAEVAQATGFADQSHLTRAFKLRRGVTPGAYRMAFAR